MRVTRLELALGVGIAVAWRIAVVWVHAFGGLRGPFARSGHSETAEMFGKSVEPNGVVHIDGGVGVNVDGKPEMIERSAIVGLARIVRGKPPPHASPPPWGHPDAHHWVLEAVRRCKPVGPVQGSLGLWRVDRAYANKVIAGLGGVVT